MDSESAATKIRLLYDEHGAEVYYRDHAATYENPHLPQVQDLLKRNFHRLDCSGKVLDFAAGGGEVTQTLRALGAQELAGCDPYTFELFEKKNWPALFQTQFYGCHCARTSGTVFHHCEFICASPLPAQKTIFTGVEPVAVHTPVGGHHPSQTPGPGNIAGYCPSVGRCC